MQIIEQWNGLGWPVRLAVTVAVIAAAMLLPEIALLIHLGGVDLGALMMLSALAPLLARLHQGWSGLCALARAARREAQGSALATPAGFPVAAGSAMLSALLVDGLLPGLMFWLPLLLPATA